MTNSRNKGAAGERELAKVLSELLGCTAKRGQQHSGLEGKDVVIGVAGIHVECKRVQALNLGAAMEQSVRDADEGEIPVVCHRKNNKPWLITFDLTRLIELSNIITDYTND
tara:strand:- start:94 stop:426 length:333 start_codon:yes stop_codon:yes gene_type:complete